MCYLHVAVGIYCKMVTENCDTIHRPPTKDKIRMGVDEAVQQFLNTPKAELERYAAQATDEYYQQLKEEGYLETYYTEDVL